MADANLTLIRKNGGTVTAYDDAVVFHSAIGHDYSGAKRGVVLKGIGNQLGYTRTGGRNFRVLSGMGMLYGRQFRIPDGQYVDLTLPSAARKVLIYVEVSITQNAETVQVRSVSGSSPTETPTIGNADIYANATGVATMPLYLVTWSGTDMTGIEDLREIREPGEAEKARSIASTGTIDGTLVSALVEPNNTGYCVKAREAAHAETTEKVNGQPISNKLEVGASKSCKIATFAKGTISDSSGMTINQTKTYEICSVIEDIRGLIVSGSVQGYRTDVMVMGFVPAQGLNFYIVDEDNIGNQNVAGISYRQGSAPVALVNISRSTAGQTYGKLIATITCLIQSISSISLSITAMQGGA